MVRILRFWVSMVCISLCVFVLAIRNFASPEALPTYPIEVIGK
jgi:hypothetical protein